MPKKTSGKTPQQQLNDIRQLIASVPLRVGNTALNHFKDNFVNEGFDGDKWKPRSTNAPRNEGRKLLLDTNRLYRALKKEVAGGKVRVYVAAPADAYGAVHNTGNKGTARVKAFVRRSQRNNVYGISNKKVTANGIQFVRAHTRQMDIPMRRFIGQSKLLDAKIYNLIYRLTQKAMSL